MDRGRDYTQRNAAQLFCAGGWARWDVERLVNEVEWAKAIICRTQLAIDEDAVREARWIIEDTRDCEDINYVARAYLGLVKAAGGKW